MIERSKLYSNVLLIFCDSTYFIFNKLQTVSIARSVMVGLCHPVNMCNNFFSINQIHHKRKKSKVVSLFSQVRVSFPFCFLLEEAL